jgi:hypothetical protein
MEQKYTFGNSVDFFLNLSPKHISMLEDYCEVIIPYQYSPYKWSQAELRAHLEITKKILCHSRSTWLPEMQATKHLLAPHSREEVLVNMNVELISSNFWVFKSGVNYHKHSTSVIPTVQRSKSRVEDPLNEKERVLILRISA